MENPPALLFNSESQYHLLFRLMNWNSSVRGAGSARARAHTHTTELCSLKLGETSLCCYTFYYDYTIIFCRSQLPRGLSRRSTAARLLRSSVRIPLGHGSLSVVLSGRGLCDELITRPEESYRLWRVVVCVQETAWYEEAIACAGLQSQRK
jgi:hypothetical protein